LLPPAEPSASGPRPAATIGQFLPLDCNAGLAARPCSGRVSSLLPAAATLVIPCGECWEWDVAGDVVLPGGLDVVGRLVFPAVAWNVTVRTASVVVRGALEVAGARAVVSAGDRAVKFVLTGAEDVVLGGLGAPNAATCAKQPGGVCNLGAKPFVVAGGRLDVRALPSDCRTWTKIKGVVRQRPDKNPDDFALFRELPPECPARGIHFIDEDFADGIGEWTGRRGGYAAHDGGEGGVSVAFFDGEALKVTNRKIAWQGPWLDYTALGLERCLLPDTDYLLSTRYPAGPGGRDPPRRPHDVRRHK